MGLHIYGSETFKTPIQIPLQQNCLKTPDGVPITFFFFLDFEV